MKRYLILPALLIMFGFGKEVAQETIIQEPQIGSSINISYEKDEIQTRMITENILLDVPLLLQQPVLPTGCEIVSVSMLLQYRGVELDPAILADIIPYHEEDPALGFVGNPYSYDGWSIYPEALIDLVKSYIPDAEIIEGGEVSVLKDSLGYGKPVVVWVSDMHGFYNHSVILTGFDEGGFFYNDPWSGEKNAWIEFNEFMLLWGNQEYRGISG
ncbi:MAG: C39 family peptidase [Fusobacteria bacterium]|nr:C39 family peptidase [Fusobacteriota bacterium]